MEGCKKFENKGEQMVFDFSFGVDKLLLVGVHYFCGLERYK